MLPASVSPDDLRNRARSRWAASRDPALAGTESAGALLFGRALAAVLRVLSQGYTAGRVVSVAAGCGCDHSEVAVGAVGRPRLAVLRAFFYITRPTARSQPPLARVPGPSRRDRPKPEPDRLPG